MKKNFKVFVVMFCLAVLCNCGRGDASKVDLPELLDGNGNNNRPIVVSPPSEWLSADIVRRIRQDYFYYRRDNGVPNLSIRDVWIHAYYGIYNNYVTVLMHKHIGVPMVVELIIGNTLFIYPNADIIAWRDGQIYELGDLYDQGALTRDALKTIAYYHHGVELNLKNHAGLRSNIRSYIKTDYVITYLAPFFPKVDYGRDAQIEKYYGSYCNHLNEYGYNDCVAVMMTTRYDEYMDEAWEITVAGSPFYYNNGNRIILWKSPDKMKTGTRGRFYELQDAYDLGLLTEEDVRWIAYYHETDTAVSY
jgi:hypothetical protein